MSKFYTEDADVFGKFPVLGLDGNQAMADEHCNNHIVPEVKIGRFERASSEGDEGEENVYDSLSGSDDDYLDENVNDEDENEDVKESIVPPKTETKSDIEIRVCGDSLDKETSDDSNGRDADESEEESEEEEEVVIRQHGDDHDADARNDNPMFFSVLALRPADSKRSPWFKRKEKKRAFRSQSPLPHVPEIDKIDPNVQWPRLLTWFLGPKAENEDIFLELATSAIRRHCQARRCYFRTDAEVITDELKQEVAYKVGIEQQKKELERVSLMLEQSVPTFSPRYQGHMLWDTCMPANLGYLQAFLYNQNNVALEASPVTSKLEVEVSKQICEMIYETCKQIDLRNKDSEPEDPEIKPWGHLVSGGSLANIESLWAVRNTKFVPLALKKVIADDSELKGARNFMIHNAKKNKMCKLLDSYTWDLLNLDLDEIIRMPREIAKMADCPESYVMTAIQKYSVTQIGMYGLMKKFGIKKAPVVITPATNHYSWPKAANVLGLGIDNLRQVGVDERCRMDMEDLEQILRDCEETKTPVLTVVAVIGTTEESAVDPLVDILELKETMRKKGLTFTINADAAWGGYFMTMLTRQSTVMTKKDSKSYVPCCSLSVHTIRQLEKLHKADTITIDPHKSGFVPYSAGFLCYRNGEMKKFVKMEATVIAHEGEGEAAIGICTLEGSRPGAAAAGVLMAHNTIGLNNDGYGRILGQCTFGAKLFYCRWLTLAKDSDNFIVVPMKNIPEDFDLDQTKETINMMIFGEDVRNENILKVSSVRRILRYIGPDMLITAFAVNIVGNTDIRLCNKLNKLIFNMLSHSGQHSHVRRVPLILTQSEVSPKTSPKVVKQFKQRLGLNRQSSDNLHFLINTVMNPWIGTPQMVSKLGDIFRQTVITAIGTLTDPKDVHCFVCVGKFHGKDKNEIFAELVPSFISKPHQYQAIVKFQLYGDGLDDVSGYDGNQPMLIKTLKKMTLGQLLQHGNSFEVDIEIPKHQQTSVAGNMMSLRETVKVIDVPLLNHFDMEQEYYPSMTYFLYGNNDGAYMSHMISQAPDFFQVLHLDTSYPKDIDDDLLHQGILIEIDGLLGQPIRDANTKVIVDPLTESEYKIRFNGDKNISKTSTIRLTNAQAKVMFKPLNEKT